MLKILKWAFKLGQQIERNRIATILNEQKMYRPTPMHNLAENLFRKEDKPAVRQEMIDEIDRQVNRRVQNMISVITEPNTYDERRYSLLFPQEDK